jgi:outer membrane protein OmpA-like peptidoglycan-associated protein
VNSPINRGRHVTLVGFADANGQPEDANQKSSKARAEAVASILGDRGLAIASTDVVGLGSALPVAPNDSKDGRAKNRRVEVWLH